MANCGRVADRGGRYRHGPTTTDSKFDGNRSEKIGFEEAGIRPNSR